VGELVRFVAVVHPTRGKILLMSTDLTLDALDIISLYGFRFKIICGRPHMIFYVATRDMWRRYGSMLFPGQYCHLCATYLSGYSALRKAIKSGWLDQLPFERRVLPLANVANARFFVATSVSA
jgi:hypothetical protein